MNNEVTPPEQPNQPPEPTPSTPPVNQAKPWGLDENVFNMLLHLSLLTGFIIPFGGLIMPLIMWGTNKDQFPSVDKHGRIVLNWAFSALIYFCVSFVLMFVFVGLILIWALIIVNIVFVIIGAIKASKDEYWPYPMSIPFFKTV